MTDNEQVIAQAIARAFETLSERLSKELEDALNQMAQLMGRAQKQQYEIMSLFGKQATVMEALADLVAKVRNDDVERHNEHATAIEQLSRRQIKIAQFTEPLAISRMTPFVGRTSRRTPRMKSRLRCVAGACWQQSLIVIRTRSQSWGRRIGDWARVVAIGE